MTDFIAFDLEIAKIVEDVSDLDPRNELGISCAATLTSGGELKLWHGREADGGYAARMEEWEAWEMATWLHEQQAAGVPIVTWNGLGFDFHVLATESGDFETCAQLAVAHVDLMFAFQVVKGFPLSLKKAALACGNHKGAGGIESGADAPRLWAAGRYDNALAYVAQDVRATADVARYPLRHSGFTWISNSGRCNAFQLPRVARRVEYPSRRVRSQTEGLFHTARGLTDLTAEKVREWPCPDTSWMTDPIPRERLLRWLTEN